MYISSLRIFFIWSSNQLDAFTFLIESLTGLLVFLLDIQLKKSRLIIYRYLLEIIHISVYNNCFSDLIFYNLFILE